MSTDPQLFDETFTITTIDSQKYDRVARLSGSSQALDVTFSLDVNTDIFPCAVGDTLHLVLASTLNLDGAKDGTGDEGDTKSGWREASRGESTLADLYDYVCYGRIYRFDDGDGEVM
jgi:DNA-directed RNA polymerase I, II, and III subunit RPABC3